TGPGEHVRVRLERGPVIEVAGLGKPMLNAGQGVRVMVRPERFIDLSSNSSAVHTNRIEGSVIESAYIGVSDKYRISTSDGLDVLLRLPTGPSSRRYRVGERIAAGFHAADARLI